MSELEKQLLGVTTLLQLEKEARRADSLERFRFVVVNETYRLFRYRQAVLWEWQSNGQVRITAISGLAQIDRDAPFVSWLRRLIQGSIESSTDTSVILSGQKIDQSLLSGWKEFAKGHVLLCPLSGEQPLGGLYLVRDEPWGESDSGIVNLLADAYGHAWGALVNRRRGFASSIMNLVSGRKLGLVVFVLVCASLFLPVRQSVLAPAEIVPLSPIAITSPMDGVIQGIEVKPNSMVSEGQLLVSMDDTALRNRLEIEQRAYEVAKAEEQRAAQKSFADIQSKGEVALLRAQANKKQAEVDYVKARLERSRILSPQVGVAVFADPNEWIGKPVVTGERVMLIADPDQVQVEIWMPVQDAVSLQLGAEVRLFLDTDPVNPWDAKLVQTSYEAEPTQAGVLAFRLKADFPQGTILPHLGLRGTAKIYGEQVSLAYYLFRRPVAAVRQWLGL